ncbi:MAG: metal-binding protein [Saprospiraceae bacterium]
MIKHSTLADTSFSRLRQLKKLINKGKIQLGGNANLKIYGTLNFKLGKRLKVKNRVFFANEEEALEKGYRPCGHSMRKEYQLWKANNHS